MRKILLALTAVLFLSGCQTTDNTIRENLAKACAVVDVAHETFLAVAATVAIEQKYVDSVEAAYASAQSVCQHPETATTLTIVSRVVAAGARIYAILTQVTQANPAAMRAIQ